MTTPSLSIVVSSYNVAPWLDESLWSARRQTLDDIEIIVVDDGSTDASWEIALRHAHEDPRIVAIRQRNQGVVGTRNTGLSAAHGEFVGYLDGDDRWMPDKGARHVAQLRGDPSLDASFSWYHVITAEGGDTGRYGRSRGGTFSLRELLTENFVGPGQPVMRRSALRAIGLYDHTMTGHEDHEFILRLGSLRDRNVACIPRVLAEYRRRPGQVTRNLEVMHFGWRRMMDRMRARVPSVMADVEREATARHYRYLGYLAWEQRDYTLARAHVACAWRTDPLALARDRRAWFTAGAVLVSRLPASTREPLRRAAEWLRAHIDIPVATA